MTRSPGTARYTRPRGNKAEEVSVQCSARSGAEQTPHEGKTLAGARGREGERAGG